MNFFRKFFGPGDPLAAMQMAVQQKRWADALAYGADIDLATLAEARRAEVEDLLVTAGDALARVNLAEGDACLRSGDASRAREHFSLAAEQARTPQLKLEAESQLRPQAEANLPPSAPPPQSCCPSNCGTAAGADEPEEGLDRQSRLELTLASYPPELADRYRQAGEMFHQAFLLAHEGRETQALELFDQIPPEQRDELYFFERGSLLARVNEQDRAAADLETAAEDNRHPLALETLVRLDLSRGLEQAAEERLNSMLGRGESPAFSHGRLAVILARRGELGPALEHAEKSIESGTDPEILQLAAALLERQGRLEEAQACLARLSSAGCGSQNLPLAEFWLRHGSNLDRALQAFKGALRQEPASPRWMLRIAQVYLARSWQREGIPLLEKALGSPDLDPDLRREGEALLREYRN